MFTEPHLYLLASLVALAVGPIVYFLAARNGGRKFPDSLLALVVAGLVLWEVLPQAFADGGIWTVPFLGIGLVIPFLFERISRGYARGAHVTSLLLALLGLMLHALFDGTALTLSNGGAESFGLKALPLAVILHRVPVGLTLWLLLPAVGSRARLVVFGLVAMATTIGFAIGPQLFMMLSLRSLAWFQALVAGSLLHVLFHRHSEEHHGHLD